MNLNDFMCVAVCRCLHLRWRSGDPSSLRKRIPEFVFSYHFASDTWLEHAGAQATGTAPSAIQNSAGFIQVLHRHDMWWLYMAVYDCYDVCPVLNQAILEYPGISWNILEYFYSQILRFTSSETGLKPKARPSAEMLLESIQTLCWETSGQEDSGNWLDYFDLILSNYVYQIVT